MRANTSLIAIAVSVALLTSSSIANAVVITDAESLQQSNQQQFFSQTGLSGESARVIPGGAAKMPLPTVSKMLIPSSWKITGSGNFQNVLVDWRGNMTWPQILRDLAQREKIYISLDWVSKVATINVPDGSATLVEQKKNNVSTVASNTKTTATAAVSTKPKADAQNSADRLTVVKAPDLSGYQKKSVPKPVSIDKKSASESLASSQAKVKQQSAAHQQSATTKYVKDLEAERQRLMEDNNRIIAAAQQDKQALSTLKANLNIADNKGTVVGTTRNIADLMKEFKSRWVLPFDNSFEYFSNGGYKDSFNPETPATFVAKSGDVETVIREWAKTVHYGVENRAGVEHYNKFEVEIKGTFEDAAKEFIRAFADSDRPLDIKFYPDVKVSDTEKGLVIISDLNYVK